LDPLLNRTAEAYACLYLPGAPGGDRPGEAAAELALTGRFSPDLVSLRLNFSCGWVRHESAPRLVYWSAQRSPLEVGSPTRGLLLAASGRPGALERMMARRFTPQAGPVERARAGDPRVGPFLAGAALYACLPAAGAASGLPMHQLWLAARREGDHYELGALAALAGTPNPRALASLVRLAAAAWLRKASIPEVLARLRALEITADADGLTVRGLRLAEAELLALLQGVLRPAVGEDTDARRGD
jgi:hypothetical protein